MAEIRANRVRETSLIMLDELALIKARVINEGKKADGSTTGKYSQALVPYWYHGSSLKIAPFNVKNKQKELLKKKGYFASYEDWRDINNRPTAFKNFSFTGEMFKNIQPLVVANDEYSTSYIFGSKDADEQKKIDYNKSRDGDFLKQSEEEKALISRLNRQRIINIMQKHNVT